eukprot:915271_1
MIHSQTDLLVMAIGYDIKALVVNCAKDDEKVNVEQSVFCKLVRIYRINIKFGFKTQPIPYTNAMKPMTPCKLNTITQHHLIDDKQHLLDQKYNGNKKCCS